MKRHYIIIAFVISTLLCTITAEEEKGIIIKEKNGNEGRRWALCIGINDYWDQKITDLKKARNDAKGLAGIFRTIGQFDNVYTMTDDLDLKDANYPLKFNIESRIDYVMDMADQNDLVVFSFSGHGIANEEGKSFLVTADVRLDKPFDTSFALDYIVNKLKSKKIKKSLLLIDACREEMEQSKGLKAGNFQENLYTQAELAAIFYATKAGWFSYEDKESSYGIFTRFLIQGLEGKADGNEDGIVTFSELENYVMEGVFDYALDRDMKQRPYTKIHGEKFGDLALTAVRKEYKDMVYVEGGTFMMGDNDGGIDEKPVHQVEVDDFYISKYELTQEEYLEFCNSSKTNYPVWLEVGNTYNITTGTEPAYKKYTGPGNEKHPIVGISFYDAAAYCNWISKKQGLTPCYSGSGDAITCNFKANGYRLPTEAEWEYAARGGSKSQGYTYSGSNELEEVAWYSDNADGTSHIVAQKNKPNELGIYDMSGNVWEWCWDRYGLYTDEYRENPRGPETGGLRVMRGGSWNYDAWFPRVACRLRFGPFARLQGTGLRLARGY